MQVFHIRYRNAQGALMRILNAVSRRGLDLTSVHAQNAGHDHLVTLLLETTHKQIGQLYREWYAIVDVIDVGSRAALRHEDSVWTPHPPASVAEESARAALA
jgi:acetolactate synthase small subunit